ncbi:hypothetical protein EYF80_005594 [Liparis tanakae]|uniref:Uncharacterized protein n=1 Tax=Liparis tanakae TaxID=230148 RepID=A0A4Z2J2N2_9TELE|nr:hypothetical protein EYF80_005594 [Liparis tanakae]
MDCVSRFTDSFGNKTENQEDGAVSRSERRPAPDVCPLPSQSVFACAVRLHRACSVKMKMKMKMKQQIPADDGHAG